MKILAAFLLFSAPAFAALPWQEGTDAYVPMRVNQTETIRYPEDAAAIGLYTGDATVAVQVEADGRLSDFLVLRYTHPAFSRKVVQAIRAWTYEPARVHGRNESATADITVHFESKGIVVVDLTPSIYASLIRFRINPNAFAYSARTLGQLDRIPTPVSIVKPVNPVRGHRHQKISVTFYIDEDGRVRMPAVSAETDAVNNSLAAVAIGAVSQWRFEPPLYRGHPVIAFAQQDFDFQGLSG